MGRKKLPDDLKSNIRFATTVTPGIAKDFMKLCTELPPSLALRKLIKASIKKGSI